MDSVQNRVWRVRSADGHSLNQGRTDRSRALRWLAAAAILGLLCAQVAWAAPTTAEQAQNAVQTWLNLDAKPLGAALSSKIARVETFADAQGQPAYYIVCLDPAGLVIVSADDQIEPIVGFLPEGRYDPSPTNPLGALVSRDLPGRLESVRWMRQTNADQLLQSSSGVQSKWIRLTRPPGLTLQAPAIGGTPSVSDVRVPPLVQSRWDQSQVGGANCYNYYTPNNYVCGCVATAMSQLMRYWQFPTVGIGVHPFQISVGGVAQTNSTRGGDGNGGPYKWSQMPLVPGAGIATAQCQAIGALCYDAGLSVNMAYTNGSSGATVIGGAALVSTFGYANAITMDNGSYNNIGQPIYLMINPNLDAGCPCLLAIRGAPGGHAIVVDGYGFSQSTPYHHLNLGWSGQCDAWYNLPTIDATPNTVFDVVAHCLYNVFPSGKGEIISGRVFDDNGTPMSGATVTARTSGGSSFTATTNAKGIYGLARVPSASTFTVNVAAPGFDFDTQTVTTGTSVNNVATAGNVWGVDFAGSPAGPPSIEFAAGSYTVNRDGKTASIALRRRGTSTVVVGASYSTADGTAVAGTDYTPVSGTVSFGLGVKTATISVPILNKVYLPGNKTLSISLANPTGGATIKDPATVTLTIIDNVPPPVLSIRNTAQPEGDSGITDFNFILNLSQPSSLPVTVQYQTADGTARLDRDYQPVSGTLTIPPGQSSAAITVPVLANTTYESDKTFTVNLSSQTGCTLERRQGQGIISNDDALPGISAEDAAGCAPSMNFALRLSAASALPISVHYLTVDGTAVAGMHYTRTTGTLTFAPGQTVGTVSVPLIAGTIHEADRTLQLRLDLPVNASIDRDQAVGTVQSCVQAPTLSIEDAADLGAFLSFQVRLSAATDVPVTVQCQTLDGTALAGQDYQAVTQVLTIPPGQTYTTIVVPIVSRAGQAKTVFVKTDNVANASATNNQATGVIEAASGSQPGQGKILPGGCGATTGTGTLISFCALCWIGLAVAKWGRGSSRIGGNG